MKAGSRGWPTTTVGRALRLKYGKALASSERDPDGPVLVVGSAGVMTATQKGLTDAPTIVIGRKGNVGAVQYFPAGCWPIDTTYFASIPEAFEPRFLFHQLVSLDLKRLDSSTATPSLRREDLESQCLFVPALDEQRRVVDILEVHLSRLEAAESGLVTTASRLDALLSSARNAAREGPARGLDEVATIQSGIQKQPRRRPGHNAYPFLRVANVTADGLDLAEVHQIELFGDELARLKLNKGDLLVVEGNGSINQIGRAALWDGEIEDCVHQNHLIRVRPSAELEPGYLEVVWNSPSHRAALASVASSSSGLHTLSVGKLKSLTIPVPSLTRQKYLLAVTREIGQERARLLETLTRTRTEAKNLRRSVLAAAFSGRLTSGTSRSLEGVSA